MWKDKCKYKIKRKKFEKQIFFNEKKTTNSYVDTARAYST